MTREEAIEYWELFNSEIGDLLHDSYGSCKKVLEKQREAVEFTIAALREQREEFMPPCYKPDGDGCAYQIYGPDDDEPIERCKACPLCYSDKMRHHEPKTPCDLCLLSNEVKHECDCSVCHSEFTVKRWIAGRKRDNRSRVIKAWNRRGER